MVGESGTETSASPQRQPCLVCREPILPGAKKCTECNSFQDWTRHLFRWSGVIAAGLALVPLWGIFQSLHEIAFADDRPRIQAALTQCAQAGVTAAFVNNGTRHGILTAHKLEVIHSEGTISDLILQVSPPGSLVIGPDMAPQLVSYRATIGGRPTGLLPSDHGFRDCSVRLTVNWADFATEMHTLVRQCPCPG